MVTHVNNPSCWELRLEDHMFMASLVNLVRVFLTKKEIDYVAHGWL